MTACVLLVRWADTVTAPTRTLLEVAQRFSPRVAWVGFAEGMRECAEYFAALDAELSREGFVAVAPGWDSQCERLAERIEALGFDHFEYRPA